MEQIVTVVEQEFDLNNDVIKISDEMYIKKVRVSQIITKLIKNLIDQGKISITPGNEEYFKDICEK